jgi:hypothetical protein
MDEPPDSAQLRSALEADSRGEIDRRQVGDRPGAPISFGELLMQPHRLRLPRLPSDPNSPGVQLIKRLAIQAASRPRHND